MPKKIGKMKKKRPSLKKDISDFLLSEEGKISKKNIAKIGISLAGLGLVLQSHDALGATHSSTFDASGHNSYKHSSHSDHSEGGWC